MASCTPAYTFNVTAFRAAFPAFATVPTDQVLQAYWDAAGQFIANTKYGWLACCNGTPFALNLLTAHLAQLGNLIAAGQTPGLEIQATIDKISVTLQAYVAKNQWQFWLQTTPYGMELLAFLQVKSAGGFYTPGGPGRAGFGFR